LRTDRVILKKWHSWKHLQRHWLATMQNPRLEPSQRMKTRRTRHSVVTFSKKSFPIMEQAPMQISLPRLASCPCISLHAFHRLRVPVLEPLGRICHAVHHLTHRHHWLPCLCLHHLHSCQSDQRNNKLLHTRAYCNHVTLELN